MNLLSTQKSQGRELVSIRKSQGREFVSRKPKIVKFVTRKSEFRGHDILKSQDRELLLRNPRTVNLLLGSLKIANLLLGSLKIVTLLSTRNSLWPTTRLSCFLDQICCSSLCSKLVCFCFPDAEQSPRPSIPIKTVRASVVRCI